ncbi:hypothetical protein SEEGA711_18119, partial [Salmonella enterica subsp. enterica serovar Gaminara str. ATCC BAA-711]
RFRDINGADIRINSLPTQPEPFLVAEDMVYPLLTECCFESPGKAEEFTLLHNGVVSGNRPKFCHVCHFMRFCALTSEINFGLSGITYFYDTEA